MDNPSEKTIVIIGVQSSIGLATLWSMAEHGFKIIAVSNKPKGVGLYSKYFNKGYVIKYSKDYPDDYASEIFRITRNHKAEGILCHHELQMTALNKFRNEVEPEIKLLFPDESMLGTILNKPVLLEKAKKLGLKVPQSFIIHSREDAEQAAREFTFPAVLKAVNSTHAPISPKWQFKTKYFDNNEQWLTFIQNYEEPGIEFILQEYIIGKYISIGLAMQNGKPVAAFQWIAVREYEPGLGGLRKSVPLDKELAEKAIGLCREIGYEGVCEVEFRGLPGTEQRTLMEINPRLWGGIRMPIKCGIDFPFIAYQIFSGLEVDPVHDYKTGIYSRNFLGDLKWFFKGFAAGSYRNCDPNMRNSRMQTLIPYLKTMGIADIHDLESEKDPKPAIKHYLNWISS